MTRTRAAVMSHRQSTIRQGIKDADGCFRVLSHRSNRPLMAGCCRIILPGEWRLSANEQSLHKLAHLLTAPEMVKTKERNDCGRRIGLRDYKWPLHA